MSLLRTIRVLNNLRCYLCPTLCVKILKKTRRGDRYKGNKKCKKFNILKNLMNLFLDLGLSTELDLVLSFEGFLLCRFCEQFGC